MLSELSKIDFKDIAVSIVHFIGIMMPLTFAITKRLGLLVIEHI